MDVLRNVLSEAQRRNLAPPPLETYQLEGDGADVRRLARTIWAWQKKLIESVTKPYEQLLDLKNPQGCGVLMQVARARGILNDTELQNEIRQFKKKAQRCGELCTDKANFEIYQYQEVLFEADMKMTWICGQRKLWVQRIAEHHVKTRAKVSDLLARAVRLGLMDTGTMDAKLCLVDQEVAVDNDNDLLQMNASACTQGKIPLAYHLAREVASLLRHADRRASLSDLLARAVQIGVMKRCTMDAKLRLVDEQLAADSALVLATDASTYVQPKAKPSVYRLLREVTKALREWYKNEMQRLVDEQENGHWNSSKSWDKVDEFNGVAKMLAAKCTTRCGEYREEEPPPNPSRWPHANAMPGRRHDLSNGHCRSSPCLRRSYTDLETSRSPSRTLSFRRVSATDDESDNEGHGEDSDGGCRESSMGVNLFRRVSATDDESDNEGHGEDSDGGCRESSMGFNLINFSPRGLGRRGGPGLDDTLLQRVQWLEADDGPSFEIADLRPESPTAASTPPSYRGPLAIADTSEGESQQSGYNALSEPLQPQRGGAVLSAAAALLDRADEPKHNSLTNTITLNFRRRAGYGRSAPLSHSRMPRSNSDCCSFSQPRTRQDSNAVPSVAAAISSTHASACSTVKTPRSPAEGQCNGLRPLAKTPPPEYSKHRHNRQQHATSGCNMRPPPLHGPMWQQHPPSPLSPPTGSCSPIPGPPWRQTRTWHKLGVSRIHLSHPTAQITTVVRSVRHRSVEDIPRAAPPARKRQTGDFRHHKSRNVDEHQSRRSQASSVFKRLQKAVSPNHSLAALAEHVPDQMTAAESSAVDPHEDTPLPAVPLVAGNTTPISSLVNQRCITDDSTDDTPPNTPPDTTAACLAPLQRRSFGEKIHYY